jgi:hypothetical protein
VSLERRVPAVSLVLNLCWLRPYVVVHAAFARSHLVGWQGLLGLPIRVRGKSVSTVNQHLVSPKLAMDV